MEDRPNLDYEPGPEGASYSRVGPPPKQAAPAPPGHPGPAITPLRYETAGELNPDTGARRQTSAGRQQAAE